MFDFVCYVIVCQVCNSTITSSTCPKCFPPIEFPSYCIGSASRKRKYIEEQKGNANSYTNCKHLLFPLPDLPFLKHAEQ